ncbi:hypothetical protein AB0I72_07100 [Nocardiopsis sp. NPDC049922]|uniref:hypothetical protein n=1 Tax=Nocardiopsis sp. NPDC049922 TaxID=3155157 RepID=UPI0033D2548A
MPGGSCRACARPCRSVPDELVHPPAPRVAAPSPPPPEDVEGEGADPEIDPELLARALASLEESAHRPPVPSPAPPPGSGARRAAVAAVRRQLDDLRERRSAEALR